MATKTVTTATMVGLPIADVPCTLARASLTSSTRVLTKPVACTPVGLAEFPTPTVLIVPVALTPTTSCVALRTMELT